VCPEYNIAEMVIVALETVTRNGSVALSIGTTVHARAGDSSRTHGERLPSEITGVLSDHGRRLDEVTLFAVVSGPGSFTGLRVGIAAVQGLAMAGGHHVVPVPTLEALATSWLLETDDRTGIVVACLDGQRGEVFVAAWEATSSQIEDCRIVLEPAVAKPDELPGLLGDCRQTRVVIIGDGARRYAAVLGAAMPDALLLHPTMTLAEAALRIAMRRPDLAVTPHALRPIYLRRPDAVLVRERNGGQANGSALQVRRADGRDDLVAVEALQRQTFSNPWGAESIRWELENTDVARLYVMRDEKGSLVAYCACWMVFDELHINSLAVDVDRRRQGLARRLLDHVLDDAAGAGASAATLEVRSSNVAARGLYEGLGFKVEGVRRDYYQDPREDAVILWKRELKG